MMSNEVSRRQLLKILAAAAGTAALSSVPNKWKTPVVDVGMLPAHAQALSGTGTITGVVYFPSQVASPVTSGSNSPNPSATPAGGAVVTVVGLGLTSNTTGSDGKYTINNVPAGSQSIQATVSGHPVCDSSTVGVTVYIGLPTTQDMNLGCVLGCLSGDVLIDTPIGAVRVTNLKAGMPVWTLDATGLRIPTVVEQTVRRPVPQNAPIVHLVLSDGREVVVSAPHPLTDGRSIGDLAVGDLLDGARVVKAERVPYDQPARYDLLPAGETGSYWANGIPMNSTIEMTEKAPVRTLA